MTQAFHFAGKFVLAALGIVVALWLVGASFALSKWTGLLVLAIIGIVLYATVVHWVRWLPSLLIFGVINSLLALVTHHAPTNPQATVSAGVAGLLVAYYTVGCVISYHYDATHLSAVDRLALLLYLFCMIWPAVAARNLAVVTPVVAWSISIGMVALIGSFIVHRARRGKRSAGV